MTKASKQFDFSAQYGILINTIITYQELDTTTSFNSDNYRTSLSVRRVPKIPLVEVGFLSLSCTEFPSSREVLPYHARVVSFPRNTIFQFVPSALLKQIRVIKKKTFMFCYSLKQKNVILMSMSPSWSTLQEASLAETIGKRKPSWQTWPQTLTSLHEDPVRPSSSIAQVPLRTSSSRTSPVLSHSVELCNS